VKLEAFFDAARAIDFQGTCPKRPTARVSVITGTINLHYPAQKFDRK